MDVDLILMPVGMGMYEVMLFKKVYVGQKFGRRRDPDYLLIAAEDVDHIGYLFDDMHVVRCRNYRLSVGMVFIQKSDKVS